MNNEQISFCVSDANGSRLTVEERINYNDNSVSYRIGIDTNLSGVNYFYANEGQYRMFIKSECERLRKQAKNATIPTRSE